MKGEKIGITALVQCGPRCPLLKQERILAGAVTDTRNKKPGFFDFWGAGLYGYEPRNGFDSLTPCSNFEHCGAINPRKTICFLEIRRVSFSEELGFLERGHYFPYRMV